MALHRVAFDRLSQFVALISIPGRLAPGILYAMLRRQQISVMSMYLCASLGIMVTVPPLFKIAPTSLMPHVPNATFPIWSPSPPLPPTPPISKIKTFEQVQQELERENVTMLDPQSSGEARVAQVLKDFQQVSAYWTNQTLMAREIAQRYGVATTPNPVCIENQTINVGFVPCSQCDLEGDHRKIPQLIHQTWKNSQLVEMPICEAALSWTQVNPEYDYILMDDAAIPRMVELDFGPNILASYNCIGVGAAKSDVARLLFIFLYGGIYFDMDSSPKEEFPFRSWGFGNHTVVTGMGEDQCPHQWGLLYTPQHPSLKRPCN
jgi:hypothetical protein